MTTEGGEVILQPPWDTHAPLLKIYGTPRGKHLKGDSADMVGFELLREGYVWMHNPEINCILRLAELFAT